MVSQDHCSTMTNSTVDSGTGIRDAVVLSDQKVHKPRHEKMYNPLEIQEKIEKDCQLEVTLDSSIGDTIVAPSNSYGVCHSDVKKVGDVNCTPSTINENTKGNHSELEASLGIPCNEPVVHHGQVSNSATSDDNRDVVPTKEIPSCEQNEQCNIFVSHSSIGGTYGTNMADNLDLPGSVNVTGLGTSELQEHTITGEPVEMQPGSEPEVVTVLQLRSASQFTMAIQVGDKHVEAVVDSAAEVSIISDRVYKALKKPPPKLRDVKLLTAGRQMAMKGFVAGPVRLKIGNQWYIETVYIALIEQEMLLGFDILVNTDRSILDMVKGNLTFDDQVIDLNVGSQGQAPSVARVTVAKRQVIPPNSVMRVKCSLDHELTVYVIEPVDNLKVLAPRVVRKAGEEPLLCLVNPSDKYRLIKKGKHIARAYPIDCVIADEEHGEYNPSVNEVAAESVPDLPSNPSIPDQLPNVRTNETEEMPILPEHLQQVFDSSMEHLIKAESVQLAHLLIDFQDVFAKTV